MRNPYFAIIKNKLTLRCLLLMTLAVVVVINIKLITQTKDDNHDEILKEVVRRTGSFKSGGSDNSSLDSSQVRIPGNYQMDLLSSKNNEHKQQLEQVFKNENASHIRNKHFIQKALDNYETSNAESSSSNSSFMVILIQVHSRTQYLTALIDSLRDVKYIQDILVIFSHDLFIKEINEYIEKIDFCATLQIFYPYSLQVYPNVFPGNDPNDCPKDIKKADALKAKCNNAQTPDTYGHYREHNIVQIKHHWTWKIGYVFEELAITKYIPNLKVMLLEEDYFLMPDTIHMVQEISKNFLSDIDIASMAIFHKAKQDTSMNQLNAYAKAYWHSSEHNTGMVLGRPQWKFIKNCANTFCTFDDYNWDYSLQDISMNCFKEPFVSLYPVSSRVVHIGECGIHHKGRNCDPNEKVKMLKDLYKKKQHEFFPTTLKYNGVNTGMRRLKKPNGGWSDPRDHSLCKQFMHVLPPSNVSIVL